jgi:phytoene synthase
MWLLEDKSMADTQTIPAASTKPPVNCDPRQTLARHGKSFHWATHFFDRRTANDVATLYHFCRYVDDIADHQERARASVKLSAIRAALDHADGGIPEVAAFLDMAGRRKINPHLPRLLVDAILSDIGTVRVSTWDDLVRYAYGVAATVGLMMCALMNVRDPAAQPFAVDLGIAMQLTNIARDVVEDARRDRRYLPAEWLGEDLPPAAILAGSWDVRDCVLRARKKVLRRADLYYRSADRGMRYIPWRARLAVVTAARLYEAIGRRLLTGTVPWGDRAVVPVGLKIRRTLAAIGSLALLPDYWPVGPAPIHNPDLHQALTGRPGVDGGWR